VPQGDGFSRGAFLGPEGEVGRLCRQSCGGARPRAPDLRAPPARAERAARRRARAPGDLSGRGVRARRGATGCRASSSASCGSSSPAASWRAASRAFAAATVPMRCWSRSPARGGGSARRAAGGGWPSWRRTWSTACSAAGGPSEARPPTAAPAGRAPVPAPTPSPTPALPGRQRPRRYWSRADLLRRTFALDVLACPGCGGRLRLLATIAHPPAIAKILRHLGLPVEVPRPVPARQLAW